jgi:hypothetical protein
MKQKFFLRVKGGLQEVPKGDNYPRRHFFSGNICLHLRDISTLGQLKKGYKTQFRASVKMIKWFLTRSNTTS